MKFVWVREVYTGCCTRNVRSGLVWFKAGTWKLRGMRKGFEKGRHPYVEGKGMFHMLY
jgi:hypothetical protein